MNTRNDTGNGEQEHSEANTGEPRPRVTRRGFMKGAAVAGATTMVATTPAAAKPSMVQSGLPGTVSTYINERTGFWGYSFPSGEVVGHEDGTREGILVYSTDQDAYDNISTWIDGGSDRKELAHDADRRRVHFAAQTSDVVPSPWGFMRSGGTLAEMDDVEHVTLNRWHSLVEPISEADLAGESSWSDPRSWFQQYSVDGDLSAAGYVWDEPGPWTLGESTDRVNVDDVSETGSGVKIGVIDTGCNRDSTLHGSRIVAGKNVITNSEIDTANSDYSAIEDGNGHGSWVVTAVAGDGDGNTGTGVAPGADLVVVKALTDDGEGTTEDIVSGIQYCASKSCDIIVMSLGSTIRADVITEEISHVLTNQDVTAVFAAAGNSRMSTRTLNSPAEYNPTVTVAAVDSRKAVEAKSAYYSSLAPHPKSDEEIDVAAPGHRIEAQIGTVNGTLTTETLSGTSMANPIAAGVGALVLEADSTVTGNLDALRERLKQSAEPIPNAGITEVGAGRVDAERAVNGTQPDADQSESRTGDAESRDLANRGLAADGDGVVGWFA